MDRRSIVVAVCSVIAPMAMPAGAAAALPAPRLGELEHAVGKTVSEASGRAVVQTPPAAPHAPSPQAPRPARAAQTSQPSPTPAPAAALRRSPHVASVRASAVRPSSRRVTAAAAAKPARPQPTADPTTASSVASRPTEVQAATTRGGSSTTLPFTGARILGLLAVAVLALLAGFGLRRVVLRPGRSSP